MVYDDVFWAKIIEEDDSADNPLRDRLLVWSDVLSDCGREDGAAAVRWCVSQGRLPIEGVSLSLEPGPVWGWESATRWWRRWSWRLPRRLWIWLATASDLVNDRRFVWQQTRADAFLALGSVWDTACGHRWKPERYVSRARRSARAG